MIKEKLSLLIVKSVVLSLITVIFSGCESLENYQEPDPWVKLYQSSTVIDKKQNKKASSKGNLSISASSMPFPDFARWISDKSGCGVVYSASADGLSVSCEFKKATADEIISSVSRRLGLEVVRVGNTYFLGRLKAEDRGCLVRKVQGYDQESLKQSVEVFLSEFGKCYVYTDGLVVVSDREAVLSRISVMLDKIESSLGESWILQFYLLALRKDKLLQAGFDITTTGSVAYKMNNNSTSSSGTDGFQMNDIGFDGVLNLTGGSDFADLKATPMFLLRDGSSGRWSDGQSIPIPQKTVSEYGTVTTTGFEYVDTGIQLKAVLREAPGGAFVSCDLSDSSVTGYNEYQPILAKAELKTETFMKSAGIYILGEMTKFEDITGVEKLLDFQKSKGKTVIQLWCRCYKVKGAVIDGKRKPIEEPASGNNKAP